MSKGLSSLGDVLKQAQALQEQMSELQKQAAERTVESSAGGGMVKAVVNGRMELVSIEIDPEALAARDKEMLQDLIVAAVNQGIRNAQALVAQEMKKLTGGLNLPGFDLG